MEPRANRQTSRLAVKRLCIIRFSNFMVVLRELGNGAFER
jgi:hypothetical protein